VILEVVFVGSPKIGYVVAILQYIPTTGYTYINKYSKDVVYGISSVTVFVNEELPAALGH